LPCSSLAPAFVHSKMSFILQAIENHTEKVSEYYKKKDLRVHRERSFEPYNAYTGSTGGTSIRTIWYSAPQVRLVFAGGCWYMFQVYAFMVLANILIYVTFHDVSPTNPSYPGKDAVAGKDPFDHKRLFDIGFQYTPDLSYRPWWLKAAFVDFNVFLAQMVPPVLLVLTGQTKRFVTYVGTIGCVNISKGIIQFITILPPANAGENCWNINFTDEELDIVDQGWHWIFKKPWGMTHGCNDMLWSGHTVQSCIGFLFIASVLKREGIGANLIHGVLFLYFCGYVWSVLACRMHYSVDVMLAAIIGYFVYTHAGFRQTLWCTANRICRNSDTSSEKEGFETLNQSAN